jgi:DNA polymerase-3 subunit alpha
MVDDYIRVKHGAKAEYAHPLLEPILKSTNGVILYQEQVMQIARELADYTLGGADLLRRAMGKKKAEEMAQQRSVFVGGAEKNGVPTDTANFIFDLVDKFSGYGFNKSHSAAYALVAYQTAWLKAHYKAEFMAAVLSSDMDNTDKVVVLIEECREMKLRINSPNINVSQYRFTVNDAGQIVYGLGAIKGVGAAAIEDLLAEREMHGEFQGLQDLCQRVDLRKVNRRVLEALVRAGAFDVFDDNRAAHLAALPVATKIAEQHGKMAETGQNDLFGFAAASNDSAAEAEESVYGAYVEPWPDDERLAAEKQTLGLYLTGHPIDRHEAELKNFTHGKIASLPSDPATIKGKIEVKIAGLVMDIRTRQSKSGKTMAFILLDDRSGRIEVAAFSDAYRKYRDLICKDALLVVEGSLGVDDYAGSLRLSADKLYSIEQARAQSARCLLLEWDSRNAADGAAGLIESLKAILQPYCGGPCPVTMHYRTVQAEATLQLGDAWRVHPADELLVRLKRFLGNDAVTVKYR